MANGSVHAPGMDKYDLIDSNEISALPSAGFINIIDNDEIYKAPISLLRDWFEIKITFDEWCAGGEYSVKPLASASEASWAPVPDGLTATVAVHKANTEYVITVKDTGGEEYHAYVTTGETEGLYEVTVSGIHVYGVSWDGTSTTAWTRTDDAADFTDPVPYVAGASSYGSPFDTLQPWAGMVTSERTGGTMVAIPKFWYKLTQNGAGMSIQIANKEKEGFSVSPAHMDRGDGKGTRSVVYIGKYHSGAVGGETTTYKSLHTKSPLSNRSRSYFREQIRKKLGGNIWMSDFAMRFTLWLLYLVEFADWNSQGKIGNGSGNGSGAYLTGYTRNMPYHTGTTQSSRTTYALGTQYRNIEGLWDDVYDWCDGCYNASDGFYIILNPNNFSDSTDGVLVGKPDYKINYPTEFEVKTEGVFPLFLPVEESALNGGSSTYTCDYWKFSESYPTVLVGGSYWQDNSIGMFYVGAGYYGSGSKSIGFRIMELP